MKTRNVVHLLWPHCSETRKTTARWMWWAEKRFALAYYFQKAWLFLRWAQVKHMWKNHFPLPGERKCSVYMKCGVRGRSAVMAITQPNESGPLYSATCWVRANRKVDFHMFQIACTPNSDFCRKSSKYCVSSSCWLVVTSLSKRLQKHPRK